MSAVSHSPVASDSIMQADTEFGPVSFLRHFSSAFVDDLQDQDSESGLFANAQNILITGGNFVSHSYSRLHKL